MKGQEQSESLLLITPCAMQELDVLCRHWLIKPQNMYVQGIRLSCIGRCLTLRKLCREHAREGYWYFHDGMSRTSSAGFKLKSVNTRGLIAQHCLELLYSMSHSSPLMGNIL